MVLLYVFGAVALINCVYYSLFSKFSFSKTIAPEDYNETSISLIVCAKNEADNLRKHIPLWLNQKHPKFELILINDASIDDTLEVMEQFGELDSRIQIVNVRNNEAFWGNKKYALTLGIKRARNNHLVFTDADCYPASENWLSLISANFTAEKELVLGYGAYEKQRGFLNKIIRFETLMTAVQYFSYAQARIPYMGVGRNLGYTAKLYYEKNGFMSHIKVASGDDDLFVNEAATPSNTTICVNSDAFTYSIPKQKWKKWFLQKKRHYTTSNLYKPAHKFLLGIYYISNLLFWILSVLILFTQYWTIGLLIILARFVFQYLAIGKAAKKLKEGDLIILIPFYELFLILLQLRIFISNSDEKNSQWK